MNSDLQDGLVVPEAQAADHGTPKIGTKAP
jgi:hypothetical protein